MRCGGDQAVEHGRTVFHIVDVHQNGDKFITPQARQNITVAQRLLHAGGQCDQQMVTRIMPVPVVDGLETIEVKKNHDDALPAAQGLRACLRHAFGQQGAVGQLGQAVIAGDEFEFGGTRTDQCPDDNKLAQSAAQIE